MSATSEAAPVFRSAPTWYAFLLTGFYLYAINVQGNVVPFLQAEFALSYRAVSLHSSAIAAGVILVGLLGDRVAAFLGRRRTLWLAVAGLAGGSILLCAAPPPPFGQLPWASIGACFLMGALGALIPALLPALLADLHGERRAEALAGQAIAAYVFGLAAPLVSGLAIWAGWGWRAAVLFGALSGIAIALWYRRLPIVEHAAHAEAHAPAPTKRGGHLPAAFWAYWALLIASCALEFSILFWAPAFLEQVIGFAPAGAATAAAGFPLGMLIGRIALRVLVRRAALARLLAAALALVFAGFLIYWGVAAQMGFAPAAILGIFVIGLGVAPLYPLVTNFAIGAAPAGIPGARDLAAMRMAIAFGTALLLAPIALGALADEVGLGPAHLALPALILAGYACFFAGRVLERRAPARA
jgi:fucose permease